MALAAPWAALLVGRENGPLAGREEETRVGGGWRKVIAGAAAAEGAEEEDGKCSSFDCSCEVLSSMDVGVGAGTGRSTGKRGSWRDRELVRVGLLPLPPEVGGRGKDRLAVRGGVWEEEGGWRD